MTVLLLKHRSLDGAVEDEIHWLVNADRHFEGQREFLDSMCIDVTQLSIEADLVLTYQGPVCDWQDTELTVL